MGAGNLRSNDGTRLMGPVKSTLRAATQHIDILLYDGPVAYTARLEAEGAHPGRSGATAQILTAIAAAVREVA